MNGKDSFVSLETTKSYAYLLEIISARFSLSGMTSSVTNPALYAFLNENFLKEIRDENLPNFQFKLKDHLIILNVLYNKCTF